MLGRVSLSLGIVSRITLSLVEVVSPAVGLAGYRVSMLPQSSTASS